MLSLASSPFFIFFHVLKLLSLHCSPLAAVLPTNAAESTKGSATTTTTAATATTEATTAIAAAAATAATNVHWRLRHHQQQR